MTWTHKWEMGDPERVAMRREAEKQRKDAVCGECAHRKSEPSGDISCEIKNRRYGDYKCDNFKNTKIVKWEDLCK